VTTETWFEFVYNTHFQAELKCRLLTYLLTVYHIHEISTFNTVGLYRVLCFVTLTCITL